MNRRDKVKTTNQIQYFDFEMVAVIVVLAAFGLVMLYSATAYMASMEMQGNDTHYFTSQLFNYVLGFIAMFVVSNISYKFYGKLVKLILACAIGALLLTQVPGVGVTINGATRWIEVGPLPRFQPSEIAKIAVILYVPWVINRFGLRSAAMMRILGFGGLILGIVFFLTNNLSTTIIIGGIIAGILIVAHKKGTKVLIAVLLLGIVVYAGLRIFGEDIFKSQLEQLELSQEMGEEDGDFRFTRILAWLYPEKFASEESYQTIQGLYALGSGGVLGKGLGNGTQKLDAIPEIQNDMILVSIGEELGIIGVVMVLTLFGVLLYRLLFIARNAPDLYSGLIVTGIFIHIALQVIINVGVVTAVIPNTGVTLPFISYGGTAILFLMAEMGIALNVSKAIKISEDILEEEK